MTERRRFRVAQAGDRYLARARTRPVLRLPLTFLARYPVRQGALLASATAFRLFLWLLPLTLLASGVVAGLSDDYPAKLEDVTEDLGVTGAASREVVRVLHDGHRSWWIAVLVGGVLLGWTTRTLMRTLTAVAAQIWAVPVPRPELRHLALSCLVMDVALIVVTVATAFVGNVRVLGPGGLVLAVLLRVVIVSSAWSMVCRRLPGRHALGELAPGAVLFGVGLTACNFAGRIYLPGRFARSSELYGSLGVAAVVLAWLLLIGQLMVGSMLVNAVWSEHREASEPPAG